MSLAREKFLEIIKKMNQNDKAQAVFVTNVAGKDVDWKMSFQFNLDNEDPFYVEIKKQKTFLFKGTKSDACIVMSGDPNSIIKICYGKGDFTHAISREEITVEKGKVMDVIRLTRAITTALKN
jgi:putative sterol carrier protein